MLVSSFIKISVQIFSIKQFCKQENINYVGPFKNFKQFENKIESNLFDTQFFAITSKFLRSDLEEKLSHH